MSVTLDVNMTEVRESATSFTGSSRQIGRLVRARPRVARGHSDLRPIKGVRMPSLLGDDLVRFTSTSTDFGVGKFMMRFATGTLTIRR